MAHAADSVRHLLDRDHRGNLNRSEGAMSFDMPQSYDQFLSAKVAAANEQGF
jgi:hypothetical protein